MNNQKNEGNIPNIPEEKMNMLISMVSKKMGISSETLRGKLSDGSFDNILNNLNQNDAKKLDAIANNPNLLNTVLSNPSAKKNLDHIINGK